MFRPVADSSRGLLANWIPAVCCLAATVAVSVLSQVALPALKLPAGASAFGATLSVIFAAAAAQLAARAASATLGPELRADPWPVALYFASIGVLAGPLFRLAAHGYG